MLAVKDWSSVCRHVLFIQGERMLLCILRGFDGPTRCSGDRRRFRLAWVDKTVNLLVVSHHQDINNLLAAELKS